MPTTTKPRRLTLTTETDSDIVVRVLILLRRRGCRIVSVNFRCGDRHGPGCFDVSVEAPGRIERSLESWLEGLVDVRSVESA